MKPGVSISTVLLLLVLTFPAGSHHSFPGTYDVNKSYLLDGVVTKFLFRNPHSFIFLDVTEEDGTVTTWHLETVPQWALMRRGIQEDSIVAGDEMLVLCHPPRDSARTHCGMGAKGGFFRKSDELVFGEDPRLAEDAIKR